MQFPLTFALVLLVLLLPLVPRMLQAYLARYALFSYIAQPSYPI